jgi:hypothetical protein
VITDNIYRLRASIANHNAAIWHAWRDEVLLLLLQIIINHLHRPKVRSDAHGKNTHVCALDKFSKQCTLNCSSEGKKYRIVSEYSLLLFEYQNNMNIIQWAAKGSDDCRPISTGFHVLRWSLSNDLFIMDWLRCTLLMPFSWFLLASRYITDDCQPTSSLFDRRQLRSSTNSVLYVQKVST